MSNKSSSFAKADLGRYKLFGGHHFFLTLELASASPGTLVNWRQTFDTIEHFEPIAQFIAQANEQNLEHFAHEVERRDGAA